MSFKEKLWNKLGRSNKTKALTTPPLVTSQAPSTRINDAKYKASHRLSGFFGYSNRPQDITNLKKRQSYYGPTPDLQSSPTLHVSPSLIAAPHSSYENKISEADSDLYQGSDADGQTIPTSQYQESLLSTHEDKTGGTEEKAELAPSHLAHSTQDSASSGTSLRDSSAIGILSSRNSCTQSFPTEPDTDTREEETRTVEAQLRADLEQERATVSVLQKQKEAVTRDLDYLGEVVDKLTEDNEALQKQLDEEESACQSVKLDLDIIMSKLKEATDHANTRSVDAENLKKELLDLENNAHHEQEALQFQLRRKDSEILKLKAQLIQAEKQIKTLQYQRVSQDDSPAVTQIDTAPPTPTLIRSQIPGPVSLPSPSNIPRSLSPNQDELDDQLMKLTKEKERLQSSYSKIPISGGGRQSRRRKEELEEMLDEVDSQLCKVKQKIKRV